MASAMLSKKDTELLEAVVDELQLSCALVGCDQGIQPGDEVEVRRKLEKIISKDPRKFGRRKLSEKHQVEDGGRALEMEEDILECILETFLCRHLYLDDNYLPPISAYDFKEVCLEKAEYDDDDLEDCKKEDTIEFTTKEDPDDNEFRYQDSGPEQMQGVFWLNYSPYTWSTLVSFARTREADGGFSTGTLGDTTSIGADNFPIPILSELDESYFDYAFRVLGDHNWAFGDPDISIPTGFVAIFDLIYRLHLSDGTYQDPKKFQIIPDIKLPFTCFRLEIKGCLEDLLKFEMELVENCDDITDTDTGTFDPGNLGCDSAEEALLAKKACEEGAVVWERITTGFGGESSYYVIQVVDGDGNKIDPTWSYFTAWQEQCTDEVASDANRIGFASLNEAGTIDPGFCQCSYTADLPYGLDSFLPFSDTDEYKDAKKSTKRRGLNEKSFGIPTRRELTGSCPQYTTAPTSPYASYPTSPTQQPKLSPTSAPTEKESKKGSRRRGVRA